MRIGLWSSDGFFEEKLLLKVLVGCDIRDA